MTWEVRTWEVRTAKCRRLETMGCCLRGLAKIENRNKSHCDEGAIPPDANLAVRLAVLSAAALDRRPKLSLVRCMQRSASCARAASVCRSTTMKYYRMIPRNQGTTSFNVLKEIWGTRPEIQR